MTEFPNRTHMLWGALAIALTASPLLTGVAPWLKAYPETFVVPFTPVLNQLMSWFVGATLPAFRALAWLLGQPIAGMRALLQMLPWPLVIGLCLVAAHAASGWRLAIFTAAGMLYMAAVGYWAQSMNTLALVAISVPLSVVAGFLVGVVRSEERRVGKECRL